ncbi:MAG: DUF4290 domain-containing protein [Schleiferiaceae bacterium]|jgi:hypothetical protein|nr:DUF4290 domain-containing protein [Schleiferiaceae bacterium]
MDTTKIAALALDYNTDREHLIMPEYGRHVQSMIEYCQTLTDRDHRTKVATSIVDIIGNLNPKLRDNPDYRHKLWDHLFVMSNFSLDVDSPYPILTKEKLHKRPDLVGYPKKSRTHRYYGNVLQAMIKTVSEMESSEERDLMEFDIANQMKRAYLSWNKDNVDDSIIFSELRILSAGKLGNIDTTLTVAKGVKSQNAPLNTKSKKKKKPQFKRKANFSSRSKS